MNIGKQLLSKRLLKQYNYTETKKRLLEWLEDTNIKKLNLKYWFLPSHTKSLELREENFIPSTISKETLSIEYKMDLEREIKAREDSLEIALEELTDVELSVYHKGIILKHSCVQIALEEHSYTEYISVATRSAITKIAIILGIAVLK